MKFKRYLSLLLVTGFFFALCGCDKADGGANDQSDLSDEVTEIPTEASGESAAPIKYTYFTDEGNAPLYRIVYPKDSAEVVRDAAELLREHLEECTGASFECLDDGSAPERNIGEILVGDTCRESSDVSLAENTYTARIDGENIILKGDSDYTTAVAVREFCALFDKNSPGIDEALSLTGEPSEIYRVAMTNSKDKTIDIYRLIPFCDEPILERRIQTKAGSTGINFRDDETYGEVIVAASGTYAELLEYDTGKRIWYTEHAAAGAHGAELIPGGIVAVASSTGNAIRLFDVEGYSTRYVEIPFADAHAVLWDPEAQLLWGLGETELRAFKVTKEGKNEITVVEDTDRYSKLPANLGHDLAPLYYDSDKLWVTVFATFYIYDKEDGSFTKELEGDDGSVARRRVKGIGSFSDGSIVTAYPDELSSSYQSWTTERIHFYFRLGDKLYYTQFNTPNMHHYKCRVVCTDYA